MSLVLKHMQQPIKAILFDLDGTLLDTAADLGGAVNYLLARDGLPILSRDIIDQTASQGALALIKAGYGQQLNVEQLQQLRQQFLDHYEQNLALDTCYFPGVESMLATLNQHAIPWGIVTNKPYIYAKALFTKFELLASSQVTLYGDSMSVRKPNPLPLIVAAKSLAIEPTAIAYVGDALTDIEAANQAQMISIVANYGYIPSDADVNLWSANLIINNCNELLTVLS